MNINFYMRSNMKELNLTELELVSGAATTTSSSSGGGLGGGLGGAPILPESTFSPSPYNPVPDGNDYCEDGGNY